MAAVSEFIHPTAELTVLGAMAQGDTEAALQYANTLQWQDFAVPIHQLAFQAMVNLLRRGENIYPGDVVAESMNVRRAYGIQAKVQESFLRSLPHEPLRAKAYAGTVSRLSYLRRAESVFRWGHQKLGERPDPDELYQEVQEKMMLLAPPVKDNRFVYGTDTVTAHDADMEKRAAEYRAGVRNPFNWPWASWNGIIRPLRIGMVGMCGAGTGIGKSMVLHTVGEHWGMAGKHVVIVHLEDDAQYVWDRRLARWAEVELAHIEDGNLTPDEEQRIAKAQAEIAAYLPTVHYLHAAGWTASEVDSEITRRREEGVCDAVVIDYMNKFAASNTQIRQFGGNVYSRQGNDLEIVKTMAERLKIIVFTASQGNKTFGKVGHAARKEDISGTYELSQKPQMVVTMTREEVDEGGLWYQGKLIAKPGERSPILHVRIDKQNRGVEGATIQQLVVGKYLKIVDAEFEVEELPKGGK